ncbi:MAG: alpha-L-arabinofuranosidase [Clostridia bacterium]|nr:alpha-L-arabinofuranosidase [Clostridia bacterium]
MQENFLKAAMNKIRLSEGKTNYIIGRLKQTGVNKMNINISTEKKHTISPYIYMQFAEPLGTADTSVDAGWDYLHDCWYPQFTEKVRELAPTMIRWGGCFASYYHWKEAVGPREKRVPMLNLCWDGTFSNQVGTHEVVELCRHANAEPLMVVNMESDGRQQWAYPKPGMDRLGTAEEAADWVRYCNDPDNALRKSHGVKDPYNIKYWQIGNETSFVYGGISNGFDCDATAEKTVEFADKMRAADPSIKLIAWGDSGWAPKMCETVGDKVEYIAFHHHFGSGLADSPLYGTEYRMDLDNTWRHLMNAYKSLEHKIAAMRAEAAPYGKRLAMTEGHFALPGRNRCEVLSSWAAGVSYARCLNTIERAADIIDIATMADFFGNRWQVNAMILPTPSRYGKPYLQPVGEVMKLFRHHIGTHAVDITPAEGVDMTASISEDGKKLYLHLANTDAHEAKSLELTAGGAPVKWFTAYEIAAEPFVEITELTPDLFKPTEYTEKGSTYLLPPAAVAAIEIPLE